MILNFFCSKRYFWGPFSDKYIEGLFAFFCKMRKLLCNCPVIQKAPYRKGQDTWTCGSGEMLWIRVVS